MKTGETKTKQRGMWVINEPVFLFLAGIKGNNLMREYIKGTNTAWHNHEKYSSNIIWATGEFLIFGFGDTTISKINIYLLGGCVYVCGWVCNSLDNRMKIW